MNDEQAIISLQEKIPLLRGESKTIRLNRMFLKKLTDIEFIVLWNMPNLIVEASPDVIEYIDTRRRSLNLKETKHASIQKS